jgi:hypothetical protein
MIAANNGYLLAFDNLSGLPFWLSDALCRLATGGGLAVRQLYTVDEEVLFQAARPILLNRTDDVISQPDLADGAIFLTLPPIAEAQGPPIAPIGGNSEIACLSRARCSTRPRTGLRSMEGQGGCPRWLPRMADFAHWISVYETGLWPAGTFARAYAGNRRAAIESIIEGIRWQSSKRDDGPPKDLDRDTC